MQTDRDHQRVVTDPNVMFGKPTIRGTRLTVEHILRLLASGWSMDELVREHPRLTREDIRAAEAFAADYPHNAFAKAPDAAE